MATTEDNLIEGPNPVAEPSYRGVTKKAWNRYTVSICDGHLKTRHWLGTFNNAVDAARAYDAMAIRLHGARAKTNFPLFAAAVVPRRSSTFESSSSAVSCTSFQMVETKKGLGFDLNLPPPLLDLNLPPPLEDWFY